MTRPRSQLVSLEATPYYHCISRCVRRAFLCGQDRLTGKSFDHRKPWLVKRLKLLADVFAIDIAAYAVMSNHFHLVLHVNKIRAQSWSDDEVLERWTRIHRGPPLIQRYMSDQYLTEAEIATIPALVKSFRQKLFSISKFMACLNEYMARKANLEDGCTGRFWEGRFKSQALLDETALLSCMVYVDLNPIRAGVANDLDESDFTSIQERIRRVKNVRTKAESPHSGKSDSAKPELMPFREEVKELCLAEIIPCNLKDYLALADWTGNAARAEKKVYKEKDAPKILSTLGITGRQWCILALNIQKQAITMLNGLEAIERFRKKEAKNKAA
ncbi:MAG: transposase [Pseudohongiellaceae bacterium]